MAVTAVALTMTAGCEANDARYTDDDVEYKLAAIAGESLSDASVERYDLALGRAEPVCRQDRERIADIVVSGAQIADEQGTQASILELLEGIPEAVPEELAPMDCAEIVAAVVVLMQG